MKKTLVVIACISISLPCLSKKRDSVDYPIVGKPCPKFELEDVKYYHKKTITNEDLKGKWFMLDFWGEWCVGCIRSFPKINEIQKEYGDHFQTILIGVPRKDLPNAIEDLYEKHRQKLSLDIPIVFEEVLSRRFHAETFPHQVIVDPTGVVRYITSSVEKEDIEQILNNKNPTLYTKYNSQETTSYSGYDTKIPLLLYNNGGEENNYYLRTLLTKGSKLIQEGYIYEAPDKVELLNVPLSMLYKFAFTGQTSWGIPTDTLYDKFWPNLILKVKDSTLFTPNYNTGDNFFAYSATLSHLYLEQFGESYINHPGILLKELESVFPFYASIEKTEMPCNVLSISEQDLKLLLSKTDSSTFHFKDGQWSGFKTTGMPIKHLVSHLVAGSGYNRGIPLIYDGSDQRIDLEIESVYFDDRIAELKKLGFNFSTELREINTIVIQDRLKNSF